MFATDKVKEQIRQHALEFVPNEVCGLIVFSGVELIAVRAENASEEKRHNFSIDTHSYVQASLLGEIVAYYHSHFDGRVGFSVCDKIAIEEHKMAAVLYHVEANVFIEASPTGSPPSYIGREFKIGECDCFTLIRDVFLSEKGIVIRDYHRDEQWTKNTPDIYEKNYEQENFIKIQTGVPNVESLRAYDCLLFQLVDIPYPSHAAIYLGNEMILHHPRNKFSVMERLSEPLKRRVSYVVRHKAML